MASSMNVLYRITLLFSLALLLISCGKHKETTEIQTTRSVYAKEDREKLQFVIPNHWRRVGNKVPGDRFNSRVLNFRFGTKSEVYLSVDLKAKDDATLLANANRWLGQFNAEKKEKISDFLTIELFGSKAIFVEAEGTFQARQLGWALYGALLRSGEDQLISVKMLGPKDEVLAEKENLINFCKHLTINPQNK